MRAITIAVLDAAVEYISAYGDYDGFAEEDLMSEIERLRQELINNF